MKWLKQWFAPEEKKSPVLLCIHGFGVRRIHEFDPLKRYFENEGYRVVIPTLFDPNDETDIDANQWISRAEVALKQLIEQNERVWLVGFSMGGVIASKLASLYPIERLVLLAPAFEYITLKVVLGKVEGLARNVIKRNEKADSTLSLPEHLSSVFKEVVNLGKDSIEQVYCPVLFLHGSADEVIPIRSSENAYARLKSTEKLMLVLQNVPHRILDEAGLNADVLQIMHSFFKQEIVKESTRR